MARTFKSKQILDLSILSFETITDRDNYGGKLFEEQKALVYNDATSSNNGWYRYNGSSWEKAEPGGIHSYSNTNMTANQTSNDGDLACNTGITDRVDTNSPVYVYVNSLLVYVDDGVNGEAFFKDSGGSITRNGPYAQQGDQLYWNGSVAGYELSSSDKIDFIYNSPDPTII